MFRIQYRIIIFILLYIHLTIYSDLVVILYSSSIHLNISNKMFSLCRSDQNCYWSAITPTEAMVYLFRRNKILLSTFDLLGPCMYRFRPHNGC